MKTLNPGDKAFVYEKYPAPHISIVTIRGRIGLSNSYRAQPDSYKDWGWCPIYRISQLAPTPVEAMGREAKRLRATAKRREKKIRELTNEKYNLLFEAEAIQRMIDESPDAIPCIGGQQFGG